MISFIKIKGSSNIEKDIQAVRTVYKEVGDKAHLRLDPNAYWTTIGTIKAMKELEDCNLQLLEQPFPRWDLKGMAKLHPAASMQILPLACEFTEFFQVKGSILKQKLEIENGCLKVPQGIGFGVDLDEEALSNHLKSNCSYYNLLKSYIIIRLVPVLLNISGLRRKTIEINAWEEKFPLEKPLPIRLFN